MSTEYLGQTTDFILGQDFLTWLWFKTETEHGNFSDKEGRGFNIYMEQRVVVQGGEGEHLETATVSGALSELREARLGLSMGKKVTRALLRLESDSITWQVTIKAEDFSLNSLKLPKIETEEDDDPDALLLERIYLIESCLELIDELYSAFISLRTSTKWEEESRKIGAWIKG